MLKALSSIIFCIKHNGLGYAVGGRFAADSVRHKTRSVCGKHSFAMRANQLEWSRDDISFRFSFVSLNVGSLIFITKSPAAI